MASLGRPRTLFLAAIMVITASTAVSVLTAPAWAGSADVGDRASTAGGVPQGPALKLLARLPTAAVTTGYTSIYSVDSPGEDGLLSPDQCLSTYKGLNDEAAVQYFCEFGNDQEWAIGSQWGSTGFYQLINKNGQCLGVGGASKAVDASVVGWNCLPTHPDQYWGWYLLAGNPSINEAIYAIRNLNSGYYLIVYQDQPDNNAIIVQEPWRGVDWQEWASLGA